MGFLGVPVVRSFFEYTHSCISDPAFPLAGLISVCASQCLFIKEVPLIQSALTMNKVSGVACILKDIKKSIAGVS